MPLSVGSIRTSKAATFIGCASLFIWLAALPPFQTGMWFLTEPVYIALFGVGAIAAFLLAVAGRSDAARHPLVLIPLAMAATTFVMSAFVDWPVRSWFGAPQTGEGGFWWLALGVLVALFRIADLAVARAAAVWSAGLLLLLTELDLPLNSFPHYLAFVGLALAVIDRHWSMLFVALPLLLMASHSKSAMLLVPVVLAGAWCRVPRWALAVGAPLGAMASILALYEMPSAWSRILHWRVALWGAAEPGVWWHGLGWGSFNDLVLRHRAGVLAIDPHWEGGGGGAWHSHNAFLEALLSVGILGPLLLGALFVVLATAAPDRTTAGLWASTAALLAVWPPIPLVVPFLALAIATTAGEPR